MTPSERRTKPTFPLLAAAALAVALLGASPWPARAAEFELPEGFVASKEPEEQPNRDWRPLLTIQPEEGPFSDLSAIRLREVKSAPRDPDAWLKARLTADVGDEKDVSKMLASPD